MKHTLSVLVEDESGALSRIAGLFARRGFNIDSLAVGPAEADRQSRLTMVVEGDDQTLQQMTKQLDKLVNVLQVLDLTQRPAVERELMLLKVSAPAETRSAVFDQCDGEAGLLDNIGSIVGVRQETLAVRKFSKCGRPAEVFKYQHLDADSIAEACGKVSLVGRDLRFDGRHGQGPGRLLLNHRSITDHDHRSLIPFAHTLGLRLHEL